MSVLNLPTVLIPQIPTSNKASASITGQADATEWAERENTIRAIGKYPEDWDGIGTKLISPEIVSSAIQMLRRIKRENKLSPPTAVGGTPLGRIVFEWHSGGEYLEAEIINPEQVTWMEEAGGMAREWLDAIAGKSVSGIQQTEDRVWHQPSISSTSSVSTGVGYAGYTNTHGTQYSGQ